MITSNRKKICSGEVICHSAVSKAIGLMFHKRPIDTGYIFVFDSEKDPFEISIHNLFVFFTIDVIYLDKDKRVVDFKKEFKPFSLNFTPKKKAQYIIEFSDRIIDKHKVKIGDKFGF